MSDWQRCVEVLSAGNVTILALEGEIDIYTATDFKEALLQVLAAGSRRIVVDASKVTFMDTSGASVLITGEQRLRVLGSSMALVGSRTIERLLEVAGLHDYFPLYANREEALLAEFSAPGSSDAARALDAR